MKATEVKPGLVFSTGKETGGHRAVIENARMVAYDVPPNPYSVTVELFDVAPRNLGPLIAAVKDFMGESFLADRAVEDVCNAVSRLMLAEVLADRIKPV